MSAREEGGSYYISKFRGRNGVEMEKGEDAERGEDPERGEGERECMYIG